jgi:hypothetical protein
MNFKKLFACCFGERVMFECDECSFHTNRKDILEEHIRVIHEVEQHRLIQRVVRQRRIRGVMDM